MPLQTIRSVYFVLAESVFSSRLVLWGNASKHHSQQISMKHDKIVSSLVPNNIRAQYKHHIFQLYKRCIILNITDIYKLTYRYILKYYFESEYQIVTDHTANAHLKLLHNWISERSERMKGSIQFCRHFLCFLFLYF